MFFYPSEEVDFHVFQDDLGDFKTPYQGLFFTKIHKEDGEICEIEYCKKSVSKDHCVYFYYEPTYGSSVPSSKKLEILETEYLKDSAKPFGFIPW